MLSQLYFYPLEQLLSTDWAVFEQFAVMENAQHAVGTGGFLRLLRVLQVDQVHRDNQQLTDLFDNGWHVLHVRALIAVIESQTRRDGRCIPFEARQGGI